MKIDILHWFTQIPYNTLFCCIKCFHKIGCRILKIRKDLTIPKPRVYQKALNKKLEKHLTLKYTWKRSEILIGVILWSLKSIPRNINPYSIRV